MLGSLILMSAVALGAAPPTAAKDPLQPLQFLVGHCWAGDLPREMGRDTHCFEAMYGSHFVRDKHVVHGKNPDYLGESIYAFDPKQQHIVFWYWSSDGEILTGHVEYHPDSIVFPTKYVTEKGTVDLRAVWTQIGQNSYRTEESQRSGAEWKPLWTMVLKRSRAIGR
jgi:hypothetical protein